MSDFYNLLDDYIGEDQELTDIRTTVRRCWFYDFNGFPLRLWQGKGKLHTSDDEEWIGTIDSLGRDHHRVPAIKDGRDGTSGTYNFGMKLISNPNTDLAELYQAIKNEQDRIRGRTLTSYLCIFNEDEGLRPETPIVFFKELTMINSIFSEKIELVQGVMSKIYEISLVTKDANFGRSETPNGSYSNPVQQERARQLGVDLDRGCEYVAGLSNRTYLLP